MKMEMKIHARGQKAFTLLECMIAIAAFFIAVGAILSLVSQSLQNAWLLQRSIVDAHPVLARYAATNSITEDHIHGDLGEPDLLGKGYENYTYDGDVVEVKTNHFYLVTCKILSPDGHEVISDLSAMYYKPYSPPGSLDGGNFIHK